MNVILIVVQIIASIALIGLILMQQGKGADAGASFGAGASQTFFGSAGSANAVTKLTALFATIFFLASLGLAYVAQEEERTGLQKELSEQLAPVTTSTGDSANTGITPVDEAAQGAEENTSLAPIEETTGEVSESEPSEGSEQVVEPSQDAVEAPETIPAQ